MIEAAIDMTSPVRSQPRARGPAPIVLALRHQLLADLFASAARRDVRFDPIVVGTGDRNWKLPELRRSGVVLLDGGCNKDRIRELLRNQQILGGIVLANLDCEDWDPSLAGPLLVGPVSLSVFDYGSHWSEIANALEQCLKEVPLNTFCPQRLSTTDGTEENKRLIDDFELYLKLTKREKEVLTGIGLGQTPTQIAGELELAVSTVENHKSRLMKKLRVHKSSELVRFAIRVGAAPV